MRKICKVTTCEREIGRHGAKGMCPLHYSRTRNGIPIHGHKKPVYEKCTVTGCVKEPRSKHAEYCAMHYHRKYRHGETGEASERQRKQLDEFCSVEGCMKPDVGGALCSMHEARKRRHGDVHKVIPHESRNMPLREKHHYWVGGNAGYNTLHNRIQNWRGSASTYKCVDCDNPASHWSYNHTDANEKTEVINGLNIAYSLDVKQYSPRCVPCHKRFDLNQINSTKQLLHHPIGW